MSEENSQNFSRLEFNEQLYVFYLELKGEITKKNIEIEKSQLQDIANSSNPSIILNYIRELFYMLINMQFQTEKEKEKEKKSKNEFKTNSNNIYDEYFQLESHLRKLENDIKIFLKREFHNKIKTDTLEMKLNAYVDLEREYEELKEKLKYEGGKFLDNEKKENEILILRQENSILKKEIQKLKKNNALYQSELKFEQEKIKELKNQISSLNKKLSEIEKDNIKQSNNNNSSINININNNGNSSSKLVINHENNNNNSIIPNVNSNFILRKKQVNNLTKNYSKNNSNMIYTTINNFKVQLKSKFHNIEKIGHNDFYSKKHNSHRRYINNIDNINKAFTTTYTKILSNLYCKNISPNKREKKFIKKNFSTICLDDYERTIIRKMNKSTKLKSNIKNNNNSQNKYYQNTKFPLSSKHQVKKKYPLSIPQNNLIREKNLGTYSSIVINKK